MLFRIGLERPTDNDTAFGIIIPALCYGDYLTVSAADSFEEIVPMAREAAYTIMGEMALNGDLDICKIAEANRVDYRNDPEYKEFPEWVFVDVEVGDALGAQKRINVSLSDLLIAQIDQKVKDGSQYKDRSDFLTRAALHELSA